MLQVSMDWPSTNWIYFDFLVAHRADQHLPKLVNIGSCSLHIVHGAFKSGAGSTDWNLKATLKGAFQFLHDTPARREDYTSITGSVKFPLYFCATRWIEDSVVADRLIKIWENFIKVVWSILKSFLKVSSRHQKAFLMSKRLFMMFFLLQSFSISVVLPNTLSLFWHPTKQMLQWYHTCTRTWRKSCWYYFHWLLSLLLLIVARIYVT